jgi:uncharacterized protein (TIGR00369 family)
MNLVQLFSRLQKLPAGKAIFSKAVCVKAPYFSTIHPRFEAVKPQFVKVSMPKRHSILNHLGTVHAIAMCNLAELAGGVMTDVSIEKNARWIPSGMTVKYLKKATTDLYGIADGRAIDWSKRGDFVVPVQVFNQQDELVFSAEITMKVSNKQ